MLRESAAIVSRWVLRTRSTSSELLDRLPRPLEVLPRRDDQQRGRDDERDESRDADLLVGGGGRERERAEGEVVCSQPAEPLPPDRDGPEFLRDPHRDAEQADV